MQGRECVLARKRAEKTEFVAVEELTDAETVKSRVHIIDRYPHRCFPKLLDLLQHDNTFYLVWESTDVSLKTVLISNCGISESEIAAIVWPVCIILRDS